MLYEKFMYLSTRLFCASKTESSSQVTQDELDQTLDQFKLQFGDKPSEKNPAR
jgi:hypothetical protein